jgi:2-dehydro-3-deoxygluconokinase
MNKIKMNEVIEFDFLGVGETMALFSPLESRILSPRSTTISDAAGAESNVARCLALMGCRTAWLGSVGEDILGKLVLNSVSNDGVDISLVISDSTRPTGAIFKSSVVGGSNVQYLRAKSAGSHFGDLAFSRALETKANVLHVSGVTAAISTSGRELVQEIVRKERRGGTVSFDVNFRASLWSEDAGPVLLDIARQADVVFVGLDEAFNLWGTESPEDVRRLMPSVPSLVIKDGAVDARTFSQDQVFVSPAPRREVIEAVGAGDAFAAGWTLGALMNLGPLESMELGHAIAGIVLSSPLDVPTSADLLHLPRWENR